ncbi:hypothetical protein C8263_05580 [Deinococcus arcticus]|uniref:Uncharacterized protein n=1 Tax=Deinococcus arcticus TaxID=2136176 RepID=A0A2T3WA54_9DEIO|nr:hypothetical protein C8263_05580 [Deinococcus arcticus]
MVEVYNDGLVVFVYDEANEARIQQADPGILWGHGDEAEDNAHPGTRAMLEEGAFLVYTLCTDNSVCAEILVGAPLSAGELAQGRWHQPQRARLSVPSGRLWVHSYNSLPIGDGPLDPGACVQVPPGEYVGTLHRKDWGAMEQGGGVSLAALEREHGEFRVVNEVLVLTPVAEAAPLTQPPSILFCEE